ncbi:MAG: hypothetical protein L6437_13385 [Kiritimatiellae bacterium]|nr:hypothetical protein [Verrucomicrobiota bacterium]MBU4366654.1 hypothetical protein [Verrucomicrobiota bacterium]MCG2661224.1 hypothetical protein [Kiritimatiellia bacterium]
MASHIPDEWKRKVREALDSGSPSRVIVRQSAVLDWDAAFPLTFRYEMLAAISDALDDPSVFGGRKVMDEPTETYAFFFSFQAVKMYAKVGLMPNGTVIIIYSAHKPDRNKGDTL